MITITAYPMDCGRTIMTNPRMYKLPNMYLCTIIAILQCHHVTSIESSPGIMKAIVTLDWWNSPNRVFEAPKEKFGSLNFKPFLELVDDGFYVILDNKQHQYQL